MPRLRIFYLVIFGLIALLCLLTGVWLHSRILYLIGPLLFIPLSFLWNPNAPRGNLVLLMTFFIGLLIPLAMLVDGEGLERIVLLVQHSQSNTTSFSKAFLSGKRRLDLQDQLLMATPPKPETLALIRTGRLHDALTMIDPIKLQYRSLRHAKLNSAVIIGGDLVGVDLHGADLSYAELQGADLAFAKLQGANLGAAKLQGANLLSAILKGANLESVDLQSACLNDAQLQGTNLVHSKLQGANLEEAKLQGADLEYTQLQGANLSSAELQGTNLKNSTLFGVQANNIRAILVDARRVAWKPLTGKERSEIINSFESGLMSTDHRQVRLNNFKQSLPNAVKLHLKSCLAPADTPLICEKRFDPEKPDDLQEFTRHLHSYLGKLACESPEIARGIIRQISGSPGYPEYYETISSRKGLEVEINKLLDDKMCTGLQGLSTKEKKQIRAIK